MSGQAGLPRDALTSKCLTVLIFSLRSPQQSAWALGLVSLGDGAAGDSSHMSGDGTGWSQKVSVSNPSSITYLLFGEKKNPFYSWKVALSIWGAKREGD